MISAADARAIEQATLRAVPPRELVEDDGWLLAANAGAIGRANSVTPLWAGVDPIADKIARAAAFYRARGLQPCLRVSRFARPEGLTDALAAHGFTPDQETAVETATIADVLEAGQAFAQDPSLSVRREDAPSDDWLAVFLAASADPEPLQRLRLETLRRAAGAGYYSVQRDGAIVAVGVGITDETGWAGMHGMRTIPAARRLGCARAVVLHAAATARQAGADRLYLQVESANEPARALYRALGFAQAYTYSYWRL